MMKKLLVFFLLSTVSVCLFAQKSGHVPPPPQPGGDPLSDENEAPVILSVEVNPQQPNHMQLLNFEVSASDDSYVDNIVLYYKIQSSDGDWSQLNFQEVTREEGSRNVTASLDFETRFVGDLYYMIRILDDENGETDSDVETTSIFLASPVVPDNFQILSVAETKVQLQWDASEWVDQYRVDCCKYNDSFDNYVSEIVDYDSDLEEYVCLFENLEENTTYYFRLRAENDMESSDFSSPVSATTVGLSASLTLSSNHFYEPKMVSDQITSLELTFEGESFSSALVVTPPDGLEVSLNEIDWYSKGNPLIVNAVDGIFAQTTLYIQVLPDQTGELREEVAFSSQGLIEQTCLVEGFVISREPLQSPLIQLCYCSKDGELVVEWEFDTNVEKPDRVLVVLVPSDNSPSLTDGVDVSEGFNDTGIGYFFISSNLNKTAISSLPPQTAFRVYLLGVNGDEDVVNYSGINQLDSRCVASRKGGNAELWVNELVYDPKGADSDVGYEKIEICCSKKSGLDTDYIMLRLVNGSNGEVYASYNSMIQEPEISSDEDFLYVVWDFKTIQNGAPDGLALYYDEQLIEFLSYEGVFTGAEYGLEGKESVDIGTYTNTELTHSIQRADPTRNGGVEWTEELSTWGAANVYQVENDRIVTVWQGDEHANWFDDEHWSDGVPNEYSHVEVPASTNISVPTTGQVFLASLSLAPDAQIIGESHLPTFMPVYIERDFDVDRWTYFSSPVQCLHAGWLSPPTGLLYLIQYDCELSEEKEKWVYVCDKNKELLPMEGYGVFNSREEACFCFSGFLPESPVSKSLMYTEGGDNLYFVGNPFVSGIQWPVLNIGSITGTAYLYDPSLPGYITINTEGVSTHDFGSDIPPLQGFFVESSKVGEFSLTENDRVFTNATFLKSELQLKSIEIVVEHDGYRDNAICYCSSVGSNGYNIQSDSRKIFFSDYNVPQVAINVESAFVAISVLEEFENSIQFEVRTENSQQVELTINNLELLDGEGEEFELWCLAEGGDSLVQRFTSTDISLTLDFESKMSNKYEVRRKTVTASNDLSKSDWYCYSQPGRVVISSSLGNTQQVEVFSILGMRVYFTDSPNAFQESISLCSGVYLIRRNGDEVKKVIVE